MNPWLAAAIALAMSLATTPVARRSAWRFGFVDAPGPRSSHRHPTPRAGGVAIVLGAAAAIAWTLPRVRVTQEFAAFAAGAALLAAVGLWDDRSGLTMLAKLAAQCAAAAVVTVALGGVPRLPLPPPLDFSTGAMAVPLAFVWIVGVTNAYNFMDGIDGLAALQAAITGLALALLLGGGPPALVAGAAAGAAIGFLPFNWSPATIFMGDSGSQVLGYTLATLPLLTAPERRADWVFVTAISLWFFLADATWTRLRRLARGRRWYEAHREHVYQRWVAAGASHAQVAALLGVGATLLTLIAGLAETPLARWNAILLAAGLFAAELWTTRRREARS